MSSRLGKGLDALFKDNLNFDEERQDNEQINEVPLKDLKRNPFQPRKIFDEEKIEELAQSIKEHGVFQPIIITKIKDGIGYYIVAGERRYKACCKLGLKTIPAIIREINRQIMAEIALLENLQREDLTVVEEALAYKMLIDEYSLTQQEVAERIGKSRAHITNVLRVLNLSEDIQNMLNEGSIDFGHAKVLAGLNDEKQILDLANKIKEENLSVRALEQLIKEDNKSENQIKKPKKVERDVNLIYLEEQLMNKFGTSIKILSKEMGGKLVIDFSNSEDLNRILKVMTLDEIANLVD
ncbi:ParB/RepB/Spo0J family partition protein [Mycoplasmatota bacterium]|nr:ParB/RepB/Spo0J family partition protein [Mycoplasmatota bacterium]